MPRARVLLYPCGFIVCAAHSGDPEFTHCRHRHCLPLVCVQLLVRPLPDCLSVARKQKVLVAGFFHSHNKDGVCVWVGEMERDGGIGKGGGGRERGRQEPLAKERLCSSLLCAL